MWNACGSLVRASVVALVMTLVAWPALAQSAFTYQGRLDVAGQAYTGNARMMFTLWSTPQGDVMLADPITIPDVAVQDGIFTVNLDFGVEPLQRESHLQIGVSTSPQGILLPIFPRQPMSGAPIATYARHAAGWTTGTGSAQTFSLIENQGGSAIVFAPGQLVSQSFVTPASGVITGVWMFARGVAGPAQFDLSFERGARVVSVQRILVPQATDSTFFWLIPLPEPVRIEAEQQMRLRIEAVEGNLYVGIMSSTIDPYSNGQSSYINPNSPADFTDIPLRFDIAPVQSVNELPAVIRGGSLLLRSNSQASRISISDGPTASAAGIGLLRGETSTAFIGKDATDNLVFDVAWGRAVTIAPNRAVSIAANVSVGGTLSVTGLTSLQSVNTTGPATFLGAATFAGSSVFNGPTSINAPATIGSVASPSSLAVAGTIEASTGSLATAPPITFRVHHANPTTSGWPIRIDNPAVSGFAGGMRLSSAGFLEITNRAGSGLTTGFARLDGTGTWSAISDARLKTRVEDASNDGLLAAAMRVRPVTYVFTHETQETSHDAAPHVGVLAQELREVLPDLVRDDGTYMTVNYAQLSVVAIGAIKAQQAQIESQQAQIEAQQAQIKSLRASLESIEKYLRETRR